MHFCPSKEITLNPEVKPSFQLPWFIKVPAAILSTISTDLATKFALSLFFKPLRFKTPEREQSMRSGATVYDLMTSQASDFKVFEHKGQGPKVLMIHGWSGRASQFFKIWERLAVEDFHLISIEAPGHGDYLGGKTHMLEFVDAIEETVDRFGKFDFAIGHSLGGMALFNALKREIWFSKMVIIGSPANIGNVVQDFTHNIQMPEAVAAKIIAYIENRYNLKAEEASSDYLCQIYRPEGLIIHDEYDQDVPVENARKMHRKWKDSQYLETTGLGHRKVLMDEQVINRIYDFFKN